MAFEFFFGVFGLISSDSKSHHKTRLDGDWRLFTPLGASLFKDATLGQKSPTTSSGSSPSSFKSSEDSQHGQQQQPVFNITGTLTNANYSVNEGVFSSTSSSSASSVASSGSTSTVTSNTTLIKPNAVNPITGKKYEFSSKSKLTGPTSVGTAPSSALGKEEPASQDEAELQQQAQGKRMRSIYCRLVCLFLWLHVLRLLAGLVVEKSILTLDFYHLGAYRIHLLIPVLCLAIQAAAVSLIFIRNNDETNWLVPFYSSKDYLIRSRSNFRPKIEDYTNRVNISVALSLILALISSVSISSYLIHAALQSEAMKTLFEDSNLEAGEQGNLLLSSTQLERIVLTFLVIYDVLWAIYSTYICFLVSFYFNLISSIMKSRFHGISKIIEDLAESNTTKTTNQARKITTLYLEHNEACELLDESNDFWQYLIFFTYFTYIPAYCYCLYNLFFVDFDNWPSFITWVIHTHTGFIILLISFSAAGVSTEAHAPYTSLHTLSLIQLPLDVEVNIATFLHRVRGLTIGYSCYDLFAITNASMSNTAAACASYFLIVADFSRSSVFTLAQMNATAALAGQTTPAPAPG